MGLWTMIFMLAALGMLFAAWKHHQDLKLGIVRDEDGNPIRNIAREQELQREIEDLRERVKVLERIATDDRDTRRLSSEIDSLRDS